MPVYTDGVVRVRLFPFLSVRLDRWTRPVCREEGDSSVALNDRSRQVPVASDRRQLGVVGYSNLQSAPYT